MGCQTIKWIFNPNKRIGNVLYIVEGQKTEPYILKKIFHDILNYNVEKIIRNKPYNKYESKEHRNSKIFIINTENSNIKSIKKDNQYLNNMFRILIEDYDFDIENCAIFYIFDRDGKSNTDTGFINNLLYELTSSRDYNSNYTRQGLLLLSYPSIEGFTLSCFKNKSYTIEKETGKKLKQYIDDENINQQRINCDSIVHAAHELIEAISKLNLPTLNIDNILPLSKSLLYFEEEKFKNNNTYNVISQFIISFIDLGIIEMKLTDDCI